MLAVYACQAPLLIPSQDSLISGWLGLGYTGFPPVRLHTLGWAHNWNLYSKAGQTGWAAIVPIYSQCTYFEITWGNALWFLLLFVPIANLYVHIRSPFKLAKVFGREPGFGLGLLLLPGIFMPILAFDRSTYHGIPGKMPPFPAPAAAPQPADAAQTPLQPAQPAEPPRPFKFCPGCGTQTVGGRFCRNCGRQLYGTSDRSEP